MSEACTPSEPSMQSPEVSKYDLTSLRLVMCGAAPLSAELINQLSARLPWTSIGQGYGAYLFLDHW